MDYNSLFKEVVSNLESRNLFANGFGFKHYCRPSLFDYLSIQKKIDERTKAQASLFSIASHRLANYLSRESTDEFLIISRQISEYCKVITGVEIHPNAEIGHGVVFFPYGGTVVGETCVIERNSIIHEGVILGSKWVGKHQQKTERRHPKIGCYSEIGSHAQVIGSVELPSKYKLEPYGRIIEK